MKYRQPFESTIVAIRREGRYRVFTDLEPQKMEFTFFVRCLDPNLRPVDHLWYCCVRKCRRASPRRDNPCCRCTPCRRHWSGQHRRRCTSSCSRSEEHTSELQSQFHLVCRLLLEKKKKQKSTLSSLIKKINSS